MRILDFGAGWQALHTLQMRADGMDVTAHDHGRNFDPALHDKDALLQQYDIVFASNVINVHASLTTLFATLGQIAVATKADGFALVNYPKSPRKINLDCHIPPRLADSHMAHRLAYFFDGVHRLHEPTTVWKLNHPRHHWAARQIVQLTSEEIAASNIRPAGAVGRNAVIPRLIAECFALGINETQSISRELTLV